jgi:hypothetical protein
MGEFAIWRSIPVGESTAWVDQDDYAMVSKWRWHVSSGSRTLYATRNLHYRNGAHHQTSMHRMLMLPDPGLEVDHSNGNGLDNRRANLRTCTKRDNVRNQAPRGGASSYKGVHWHKRERVWHGRISYDGRLHHLGGFRDEIDAALAYDLAAIREFGEFARTNFLRRQ